MKAKMLEYSKHFVYFPGPEYDPLDQANACLFLASDMGKHVKGQVIQVQDKRPPNVEVFCLER